ncbi:MAG: hypothetical protein UY41_C0026G0009 [Candidatus Moranbacteria bacterium GW2011_GWE1_49_15]|nr:MAG: hypothetical protein UX75_C0032G0013 [Candidatus Moranbacteria bacterium GW2011_GWE2_47_10]KKW06432.1 MAG: hypothetical protein UY41_C0026G0009 [Candidatus Moranbacteria bacterium GW2011_GWE1_49_15]HBP00663.1 hypothetical protein [Candidatus Moranbacteria bacterium]
MGAGGLSIQAKGGEFFQFIAFSEDATNHLPGDLMTATKNEGATPGTKSARNIIIAYFKTIKPLVNPSDKDLASSFFPDGDFQPMMIHGILPILEEEFQLGCFNFEVGVMYPWHLKFPTRESEEQFKSRYAKIWNGWGADSITIKDLADVTNILLDIKRDIPRDKRQA